MRISYWSSDVCSSDLLTVFGKYLRKVVICSRDDYIREEPAPPTRQRADPTSVNIRNATVATSAPTIASPDTATRTKRCHLILSSRSSKTSRSEEHTSELQSLMRISYAVFCLKKKTTINKNKTRTST